LAGESRSESQRSIERSFQKGTRTRALARGIFVDQGALGQKGGKMDQNHPQPLKGSPGWARGRGEHAP